ncbi:hypothetical protein FO519_002588 [Halicephalobus sp. NKZ332]|nr:hypothetical protein FO519_002588 [Halicephalobus sp. NKZ332]
MQEPTLSSVNKIEAEISEIDEDVEDPSSSGAINIQSHKAHRLPIDRGRIHPVKPDPEERVEDEAARSSHGSSGRSSVTISVPPDAKLLKKMVEEKEVEVCFCDIGKQLRFGLTNGGAVVYVYPDNKFSLENLTQEMIKFPYAVIQRLDSKELRILVKLKGNRHSVVDYSLNKFFTKFENLSLSFLNVINHYRRTQTEISNRIEKFENLVKINRDIWNEHAYNQAKELLPDDQIVPHLPEVHATSKNPASTIVEDFLNEMMDNNEHLYFFKLAKEFGKIMSRSSEACAAIEQILYLFETREKQFKSIKKNQIREWCECWTTLFTAQD